MGKNVLPQDLEAVRYGFRLSQIACQISELYEHYNIQSYGFEGSQDLVVRCLNA